MTAESKDTTQTKTPKALEAINITGKVYRPETFAGYLAHTLETSSQKPSAFLLEFVEIDDEQNLNVEYIRQVAFKGRSVNYVLVKFQNQNLWYANGQLFKDAPINNPELLNEIDLYKKELHEVKRIRREVDEYATLPQISQNDKKYSTVYTELQNLEKQTINKPKPETFGEKFNTQFAKKADRGELFNEFPFIEETLTPFIEFLEKLIKEGKSEAAINEHVLDFTFQYLLDEKSGKLKKEIVLALQKINSEINYDAPAVIYDIINSFLAQILYGQLSVKINVPNSPENKKARELSQAANFRSLIKFLPYIVNSLPKFSDYFETSIFQLNQNSSSSSSQSAQSITFKEFLDNLTNPSISISNFPEELKNIKYIINKIKGTIDGIVNNTGEELESRLEILLKYVVDFAQLYLLSPNGYKLSHEIKTWLSSVISDADKIDFDNPDVVNQVISAFISHTTQLVSAGLEKSDSEYSKKQTILQRLEDDAIEIANYICDAEKNKKIPNYLKEENNFTPVNGERFTFDSGELKKTDNSYFVERRANEWALPPYYEEQDHYYLPNLTSSGLPPDAANRATTSRAGDIYIDYVDEQQPYIAYKSRRFNGEISEGKILKKELKDPANFELIKKDCAEFKTQNVTTRKEFSRKRVECFKDIDRLLANRNHINLRTHLLARDSGPNPIVRVESECLVGIDDSDDEKNIKIEDLLKKNEFTDVEIKHIKIAYSAQLDMPIQSGLNSEKYFIADRYAIQNIYKDKVSGEIYLDLYAGSFTYTNLEQRSGGHVDLSTNFILPGQIKAHYKLNKPTQTIDRPHFKLEWYEASNSLLKEISLGNGDVDITEDKLKNAEVEEEANTKKLEENTKDKKRPKNYLQDKKASISDKLKLAQEKISLILNNNRNILEKTSIEFYKTTLTKLQDLIAELDRTSSKRLDNFLIFLDEKFTDTFKHVNDALKNHNVGEKEKNELRTLKNILDNLKDAPRRDIQNQIKSILGKSIISVIADKAIPRTSSILDGYNQDTNNAKNKIEDEKSKQKLTDSQLVNYYLTKFNENKQKKELPLSSRQSLQDGRVDDIEVVEAPSTPLPVRKKHSSLPASSSTTTTAGIEAQQHAIDLDETNETKDQIWNWYITGPDLKLLPIPMNDLVVLKEAVSYQEAPTWEDAEVYAFQHALKISNALQYFKEKKEKLDNNANPSLKQFYTDSIAELRKTYGEINSYLYFNSKLSNLVEETNPTTILSRFIDQKISNDKNESPELLFNLDKFIHKINDEYDPSVIKPKFGDVGLFKWLGWYFDDLNELKEQIHAMLIKESDSPYDKIKNIRATAETMVTWWTFKETDSKYYTVAFKAELSCLLADFTQGHMDEVALLQTLNNMQEYYKVKLTSTDKVLLENLKDFTTTFTKAYMENENNFSHKVDTKHKLTLQNREINRVDKLINTYTKITDRYSPATSHELKQGTTPEREQELKTRARYEANVAQLKKHKTAIEKADNTKPEDLRNLQVSGPRTRF